MSWCWLPPISFELESMVMELLVLSVALSVPGIGMNERTLTSAFEIERLLPWSPIKLRWA